MSERITLHRNIIRAIEFLSYDCDMSHEEILENHKDRNFKWEGKAADLNRIMYRDLERALNKGFLVDTTADGVDPNLKNKIISKAQETYNAIKGLEAELDYELLSLNEAIKSNDEKSIERSKKRLYEIHEELGLGLEK